MTFEELSIIVPYNHIENSDRDKIWKFIKQRYEELMPGCEICIGEIYNNPYNISKAINEAVKKSTREVLLLIDADVIINLESIKKSMSIIDEYKVVYPYDKLIRLSKPVTDYILDNKTYKLNNINLDINCIEYKNPISGNLMIKKELFKDAGGFDERFMGWGHQDIAFYLVINYLSGSIYRIEQSSIYHMFHGYEKAYKNNLQEEQNKVIKSQFYNENKIKETIEYLKRVNGFI